MASLGDLQKRLCAIFAEAQAQRISPQDVISTEVRDHFQDVRELRVAKEYIKEIEERENILITRNEELEDQLKTAKKAVDELPEEHEHRLVDLQQAERQVIFYKHLKEDEEQRADGYQKKWQEAIERISKDKDTRAKIERLEIENYEHKQSIMKQIQALRNAEDLFDSIREKDLKSLEDKEFKLMEMEKFVRESEERYSQIEVESEQFEQAYTGLVEKMDNANLDTAAALNKTSERIREMERLRASTFSEIAPLRRFYDRCFDTLQIYQRIFQQLLDPIRPNVVHMPAELEHCLRAAANEYEAFLIMHDAVDREKFEEDDVRNVIGDMKDSVEGMHILLRTIGGDVSRFLRELDQRPAVWSMMRHKWSVLRKSAGSV